MDIGAFFSGGVDPYWPHLMLISVTFLGSAAVTWGLVRESETFWTFTNLLIVGGVVIEAVCTIVLFGFDEGISLSQTARIASLDCQNVALQKAFVPRVLSRTRRNPRIALDTIEGSFAAALRKTSPVPVRVQGVPGLESRNLAEDIKYELNRDGWNVNDIAESEIANFAITDIEQGVTVWVTQTAPDLMKQGTILSDALNAAGIDAKVRSTSQETGTPAPYFPSAKSAFLFVAVGSRPFETAIQRAFETCPKSD